LLTGENANKSAKRLRVGKGDFGTTFAGRYVMPKLGSQRTQAQSRGQSKHKRVARMASSTDPKTGPMEAQVSHRAQSLPGRDEADQSSSGISFMANGTMSSDRITNDAAEYELLLLFIYASKRQVTFSPLAVVVLAMRWTMVS